MLPGLIHIPGVSMLGANVAPINLTSYTSSPPTVVSTSSDAVGNEAWRAFNNNTSDYWQSTAIPASLTIDFGRLVLVSSFSLTPRQDTQTPAPTAFTFLGSADGTNFDTLLSQSGLTWTTAAKTFTPTSFGWYRMYKFNCTASASGTVAGFAECVMNG